jgi:hypothetical protein
LGQDAKEAEASRRLASETYGSGVVSQVQDQYAKESSWETSGNKAELDRLRELKQLADENPGSVFFDDNSQRELDRLSQEEAAVYSGRQSLQELFGGQEVGDLSDIIATTLNSGEFLSGIGSAGIDYAGLSADQVGQLEALQNIGGGTLGIGQESTLGRFDQEQANQEYLDNLYNYLFGGN